MVLFASDLDNTLIYSYKIAEEGSICVEVKDGKKLSFMSCKSYELLQAINDKVLFVPITTRSIEQYRRVRILRDRFPKYALTSNGGVLLIDNEIDQGWYSETKNIIKDSISELNKAIDILKNDRNITLETKIVDDLFVFTKSSKPDETMKYLKENLDMSNVGIDTNKEKVYVFPVMLNKGESLKRFMNRVECDEVICAGDSYFDVSMLCEADISLVPNNSKIEEIMSKKENVVILENTKMSFGDNITKYMYSCNYA